MPITKEINQATTMDTPNLSMIDPTTVKVWVAMLFGYAIKFVVEVYLKKTVEKLLEPYIPNRNIVISYTKKLARLIIEIGLPTWACIHLIASFKTVNKSFIFSLVSFNVILMLNLATILYKKILAHQIQTLTLINTLRATHHDTHSDLALQIRDLANQLTRFIKKSSTKK